MISETRLRSIIRQQILEQQLEKNDGLDDIMRDVEAIAEKLTGMDVDEAKRFMKSDVVVRMQERLAHALNSAGVSDVNKDVMSTLMSKLKSQLADEAKEAKFDMKEDDNLPAKPGTNWVDSSNELGNFLETAANGAAFVLLLPFFLVYGAAQYAKEKWQESKMISDEDRKVMHNVMALTDDKGISKDRHLKWARNNKIRVDKMYKRAKKLAGKSGDDQDDAEFEAFINAYERHLK